MSEALKKLIHEELLHAYFQGRVDIASGVPARTRNELRELFSLNVEELLLQIAEEGR